MKREKFIYLYEQEPTGQLRKWNWFYSNVWNRQKYFFPMFLLKRILNVIKCPSKNKISLFETITYLHDIGHRTVMVYVSSERIRTRCPYGQKKYSTCYFERELQGYKYKVIKWSFKRKFLAILVNIAACIEMEGWRSEPFMYGTFAFPHHWSHMDLMPW